MTDQALTFRVQAEVAQAQAAMRGLTGDFQKFGAGAKAAMQAASNGPGGNAFDALRASVDPAFASMKRYQAIQAEVAGVVERGEASQAAANIVLEQAAARYMGVATAADRAEAAQRQTAAASQAEAAEVAALTARFTGLRASVDPAYASLLRFVDAERLTQAAVRAGAASQEEAAQVLDMLKAKYATTEAAAHQFGTTSRFMAANVTAQFNDIGVMLAAGQNPLQLALQQGTQLSQVFQMAGGGIGGTLGMLKSGLLGLLSPTTLLTVAIIAGGAALFQWATGAGKASDEAKDAKKATDDYAAALDKIGSDLSAATDLHDRYAAAVRSGSAQTIAALQSEATIRKALLALDQNDLQKAQADAAAKLALQLAQTAAASQAANAQISNLQRLREQQEEFEKGTVAGLGLGDVTTDIEAAETGLAAALVNLKEMRDTAKRTGLEFDLNKAKIEGNQKAIEAAEKALAEMAAGTTTLVAGFDGASASAAGMIGPLEQALGIAQSLEATVNGIAFSNIGKAAQLAALQAGQSPKVASAAGDIAEKRAQLAPALNSRESDVRLLAQQDLVEFSRVTEASAKADEALAAAVKAWNKTHSTAGGGAPKQGSLPDLSADAKKVLADLDAKLQAINEKVKSGLLTAAEGTKAITDAKTKANDALGLIIAKLEALGPAGAAAATELKTHLLGSMDAIQKKIDDLAKSLSAGLTDPLADFVKGTATASEAFTRMGDAIIDKLVEIAMQQAQVSFFEPLIQGLFGGSGFGKMVGDALGFDSGGWTGNGDTKKPAGIVHGREFVVKAGPAAKHRELLEQINSGRAIQPPTLGQLLSFPRASMVAPSAVGVGKERMGGGGNQIVNIQPPAGHQAVATERTNGLDRITDVIFEAVGNKIAGDIRAGRGTVHGAMSDTFGLRRSTR